MERLLGLAKNKKVSTSKPIRFSTWTLKHKKFKKDVRVAKRIIVSGNDGDISLIKNNSLYLGRVYREIFGKSSFIKKRNEAMYNVINIELDDKILGYTNVQAKEKQVREQEDCLEWD